MKIPFDIKYRPQIERGEYKLVTRDGRPARIVCWDALGESGELVVLVKSLNKKAETSLRYSKDGFISAGDFSDLFIITPELTESEDEKMINELQGFLSSFGSDYFGTGEWQKFDEWLEKQKGQKPEGNTAIKGGDFITDGLRVFLVLANVAERNLGEIYSTFCESLLLCVNGNVCCDGKDFRGFRLATDEERARFIHDLKVGTKLHWKPSKEQIDALEHFIRSWGESGTMSPQNPILCAAKSLYNDLTRLMRYEQVH